VTARMRIQNLQERYNRWHEQRLGEDGQRDLDSNEERLYAWHVSLLQARPGNRLLDVACGQGSFLDYAARRGFEVFGVDISDVAVESARTRVPSATVVVGDGEHLPFDDSSFDCVTCIGSLEHFPDPAAGAAEIARVLGPGGTAVVFVPNLFFLGHIYFGLRHGTQPTEAGQAFSETHLSSRGWQDLLEEAGLEVRGFETWNHIHASERVRPVVKRAWNVCSRLVPRHAAYAFAFVCTTQGSSASGHGQ
jgi:SAM-dependent methyltransferase